MADPADSARGDRPEEAALLAELAAEAARHDPVPERLQAFARAALTFRTFDAELAELLHDSALADEGAAGVRGPGGVRSLEFEAPALRIELSIEHDRTLIVQLVPSVAASVELRHPHGLIEARADELGRCIVDHVPAGPISVRVRPDGTQQVVATAWVSI